MSHSPNSMQANFVTPTLKMYPGPKFANIIQRKRLYKRIPFRATRNTQKHRKRLVQYLPKINGELNLIKCLYIQF